VLWRERQALWRANRLAYAGKRTLQRRAARLVANAPLERCNWRHVRGKDERQAPATRVTEIYIAPFTLFVVGRQADHSPRITPRIERDRPAAGSLWMGRISPREPLRRWGGRSGGCACGGVGIRSRGVDAWTFIWLMVALKIPIVALLLLVRWAVRQTPDEAIGEDGGIGPRPGGLHPHHPRARLPRTPRRGPHGGVPSIPPARIRTTVARGRVTQR
jgi:hypothetical protein